MSKQRRLTVDQTVRVVGMLARGASISRVSTVTRIPEDTVRRVGAGYGWPDLGALEQAVRHLKQATSVVTDLTTLIDKARSAGLTKPADRAESTLKKAVRDLRAALTLDEAARATGGAPVHYPPGECLHGHDTTRLGRYLRDGSCVACKRLRYQLRKKDTAS